MRGTGSTVRYVFWSLPDGLMRVGAGRDVKKSSVGFGVLQHRFGFPFDCEYNWALGQLKLLHSVDRLRYRRPRLQRGKGDGRSAYNEGGEARLERIGRRA